MDQTIRVVGERETKARVSLTSVEKDVRRIVKERWGLSRPIYDAVFFVSFTQEKRLGEFRVDGRLILLSESLLDFDFSTLRNVFLHEAAHALDYAINGSISGHSPLFRTYCSTLGVESGFEKARIRETMGREERTKEKIEKLMALSSSPFENEAMVALAKARKLLLDNRNETKVKEREEKIYFTDLYESGRIPLSASLISAFAGKATEAFILKVRNKNRMVLRAYGSLDEVESALYLFGNLYSSLEREIKTLRRNGVKVTKDSFAYGAVPEMEKKLRLQDASCDRALVEVRNENRDKTKRLCFKDQYFVKSSHTGNIDPASFHAGGEFGKNLDVGASMGRKEIKN